MFQFSEQHIHKKKSRNIRSFKAKKYKTLSTNRYGDKKKAQIINEKPRFK